MLAMSPTTTFKHKISYKHFSVTNTKKSVRKRCESSDSAKLVSCDYKTFVMQSTPNTDAAADDDNPVSPSSSMLRFLCTCNNCK